MIDGFGPINTTPAPNTCIENYGIEFWDIRKQKAPIQGSDRKEICKLNDFWLKMDSSSETFGNEGGPVGGQLLLENIKCGIALFGIPRGEDERQMGGEWLYAYVFVYEPSTDTQSQPAGDETLVRYKSERRNSLPVGARDENVGMLRFCCSSVGAHLDVDCIFGKVEGVWSSHSRAHV